MPANDDPKIALLIRPPRKVFVGYDQSKAQPIENLTERAKLVSERLRLRREPSE